MAAILIFKSITYAQRAERILYKSGIPCSILKAPTGMEWGACAHCVKISDEHTERAKNIMKSNGMPVIGMAVTGKDGRYTRVKYDIS